MTELHAETLVVQPGPASSSSQPPVCMDTFGMGDLNTLPVIHTKEPSYNAGQPLPIFNNSRRRFIRGSEYESHKQRRLSYNLNADDTGAQAGGRFRMTKQGNMCENTFTDSNFLGINNR